MIMVTTESDDYYDYDFLVSLIDSIHWDRFDRFSRESHWSFTGTLRRAWFNHTPLCTLH